jgi:predicted nucleic-acid-binding protein
VVAVDTNVVIRLVTNDHPAQAARAVAVFRSGPVFISKSVLLEAAWVLRYSYDLDTDAIVRALRGVLGLASVSVEDPAVAVAALRLCEQGLDFADALHLASSGEATLFVTFDAQLVKRAARIAPGRVGLA